MTQLTDLQNKKEVIVEIHNSSTHDGAAAVYLPDKQQIMAIASERVPPRTKHESNSHFAYEYLKNALRRQGYIFNTKHDHYTSEFLPIQPLHHHLAHAASAFYPSGFKDSAVVVIDGYGFLGKDYVSTSIWMGHDTKLELLQVNSEADFPSQSLGYLYESITYYLGFGRLEAGKTMGLAPYGSNSAIYEWLKKYVRFTSTGDYQIEGSFIRSLRFIAGGSKLAKIEVPTNEMKQMMDEILAFLGKKRVYNGKITERDKNLAWAVQTLIEESVSQVIGKAKVLTQSDYLCLSGGVALNSVANGKIERSRLFKDLFIQPASGDDGQAIGKLLYTLHNEYRLPRFYHMKHAYLGPEYSDEEIMNALIKHDGILNFSKLNKSQMLQVTAEAIRDKKVVGWFQGGSELGPRALGHRSILADPRSITMRDYINSHIKFREWFRPLCPSVLKEKAGEFFELADESEFMLLVYKVKPSKVDVIPAVTHVDNSARIQTLTFEENGIFYELVKQFEILTGVPVLLNTSFNVAGEPLVETPEDAVKCFLNSNLDMLVLGNFVILKQK